jgi:signal transduction histidine kinase
MASKSNEPPADAGGPVRGGGAAMAPGSEAALLESFLFCCEDIVFALNTEYIIVLASYGMHELLGTSYRDLVGCSITDLVSEPEALLDRLEQLRETFSLRSEVAFRKAQGPPVVSDLCLTSWTDSQGRVIGFVGVGKDLTVWRTFHDDLVRVDRLAEMGRMAAGIVHELKNPVSVINQAAGWGAVVVSDNKDLNSDDRQELSSTFHEIEQQTERCKKITNQILDFVRESGPEKKAFDVIGLIEDTLRYLEPELKFPPISVARRYATEACSIVSDYKLLQQVLVNLISNAVYAIREKRPACGQIEVSLQQEDKTVSIAIADNGAGIPQDKQRDVFRLFFTTKPIGKGTGLGLPISKNIMHKLGGEITFRSIPGEGTEFRLTLPAA